MSNPHLDKAEEILEKLQRELAELKAKHEAAMKKIEKDKENKNA